MKNYLVKRAANLNKILSEEQRLKILKILASSMEESLCVSDVAKILGITQPAATKHLKLLEGSGFLGRKRKGTNVYYSLNTQALTDYRELMDQTFEKGFTQCPYGFKCEECPYGETCL